MYGRGQRERRATGAGDTLSPVTASAEAERRRRIGVVWVVLVVALFIVQLVSLALGLVELAAACAAAFIAGWFVLRSQAKRRSAEEQ